MNQSIELPLWLVALLAGLAAWTVLQRVLVPSLRFVLRRRVNRLLEELDQRLPIRIKPFRLTKRRVLIDRLRFDPQVMEVAEAEAEHGEVPREVVHESVHRYAREIVPAFNAYLYFRFGYWLSKRVAQLLYRVRLGVTDEEALRDIDPDATVVFVMNHRSNMDYLLVSYLAAEHAALSYAVGEWARVWPLQTIIRSMGAYFVRRRSGNALYRKVLERYVDMATRSGVTQAVFPEGGLSRDGRLQAAKLGLLDYMLRGFDAEEHRDVVFVPVGINYDRVLEDRTLLLDLEKEAERKPAVSTTLRFAARNLGLMARNRWHRFGYACASFGTPISARAWARERGVDFSALDKDARFVRVAELAADLMGAVGTMIPVVPVPMVAHVLLHADRAASLLEVKTAVFAGMKRAREAGAHVYVPRRDQDYMIEVGLRMLVLRHLVIEEEGLYRVAEGQRHVLAYYAHSIEHHLISDESDRMTPA